MTCPNCPRSRSYARGVERWVAGRTIESATVLHPRAARRHTEGPADLAARLTGRLVSGARRRGKYLWLPVGGDEALLAHLGMSGQLIVGEPGPAVREASAGPVHLHRRRPGPALRRPAHLRPPHAHDAHRTHRRRRRSARADRAHRARPAGEGVRRGGVPPRAAAAPYGRQARAARPVADQRRGQHLRRRGAVAGQAALGAADRDPDPWPRRHECWRVRGRSWARPCWRAARPSTACT